MKKTLFIFLSLFCLSLSMQTMAQETIDPADLQGNMSIWSTAGDGANGVAQGFTWSGSTSSGTVNVSCPDGGSNHTARFKLNKGAWLQLPALTEAGVVKVHLFSGTSSGPGIHSIILEKLIGLNWEIVETWTDELPKASQKCLVYTLGKTIVIDGSVGVSDSPVTLRIRNNTTAAGFGSIWLYEIEVTNYGDDGSAATPGGSPIAYSIPSNDMPKPTAGPVPMPEGTPWQSKLLNVDCKGRLIYNKDDDGFILPDFSHAGYKNGNEALLSVSVVKEINPVAGDNTANIQAAIDAVGAMSPDANGIRGALLLKKGLYPVKGPLYVNYEGVVIRGEGTGGDPSSSTIVYDNYRDSKGENGRSIFVLGNKSNDGWDQNKSDVENILDDVVPVGSFTFKIKKNTNYKAGDMICINHPCTQAWLEAVGYGGNSEPENTWTTSSAPIAYHRYIIKVIHSDTETKITIDAPVFYSLTKSLSQSTVHRFTRRALQNIGIENLRVDIGTTGIPDENHAWNCVSFRNAENCWARNVVALHFGQSGFVTERSTRLTIEDCLALDPVGIVTGGRMYNFNNYAMSQLVLFKNCYARGGRHNYISNGTSKTSGCVVYKCKSEGSRASSEGHRLWTQGMLFDSYEDFNPITGATNTTIAVLGYYNRIDMGSGHGWAMANGVLWNCNSVTDHTTPEAQANSPKNARSVIYCEKPPTSQNYAIGCFAERATDVRAYKKSVGYVEGANKGGLFPASLYQAQFDARNTLAPKDTEITFQPKGDTICEGTSYQLQVFTSGAFDVDYQWQKNGNDIPGAIGNFYDIKNASSDDAASYCVVIKDMCSTITSDVAKIVVLPNTMLIKDIIDDSVCEGSDYTFNVETKGAELAYQWYLEDKAIEGATDKDYLIRDIGSDNSYGSYQVKISGRCGSNLIMSSKARLWVAGKLPEVLKLDAPDTVYVGQRVKFSVGESYGYEDVTNYSWEFSNQHMQFSSEQGPYLHTTFADVGPEAESGTLKITMDHICKQYEASKPITIMKQRQTGIDPVGQTIEIYPNPVKSDVFIMSGVPVSSIRIMNISGQTVYSGAGITGENEITISMRNLKSGIYFIQIISEAGKNSYKIIKE